MVKFGGKVKFEDRDSVVAELEASNVSHTSKRGEPLLTTAQKKDQEICRSKV